MYGPPPSYGTGGRLLCVIGASCCALAYASDPSESTLAATAALIGAARLALISDICSRSGSCSTSWASSSCLESLPSVFFISEPPPCRRQPGGGGKLLWLIGAYCWALA